MTEDPLITRLGGALGPDTREVPLDAIRHRARRRRGGRRIAAALSLVAVAGLLAWALVGLGGLGHPIRHQRLSGERLHVIARIAVPGHPGSILTGTGWVWSISYGPHTLARIDPQTNRVTGTLRLNPTGGGPVVVGGRWVWVNTSETGVIARIDPSTLRVSARVHVTSPGGMAFGSGSLWVADFNDRSIVRIDPATAKIIARVPIHLPVLTVATGPGVVWGMTAEGILVRIDPATDRVVARIPVATNPLTGDFNVECSDTELATIGSQVYVVYVAQRLFGVNGTAFMVGRVSEVDPTTNRVGRTLVLHGLTPICSTAAHAAGGILWVMKGTSLVGINPSGLTITKTLPLPPATYSPPRSSDFAFASGSLWVAEPSAGAVLRAGGPIMAIRS